ncbi:MAG: hypothetical protein QOG90_1496 [Actinomycetota bacterium]
MVFTSPRDPDAVCTTVRRHLKVRGYNVAPYDPAIWIPPGQARCSFRAPARRVRHTAEVRAVVLGAETGSTVEVSVNANDG